MIIHKQKTIADVLKKATELLSQYNVPNPSLDAQLLLGHVLKLKRLDLYLNLEEKIDQLAQEKYQELITKRAGRIPLAYITGEEEFMGLSFLITEDVLVPRPETEILVETVLHKVAEQDEKYVLVDMGTGSGNIAISLGKFIDKVDIYAIDISAEALLVARDNAQQHAVAEKITLLHGDLFKPLAELDLQNNVDFLISNPPYIKADIIDQLQPEVGFEPRLALDGGTEGLDFYERIIREAGNYLKNDGYLVMEMPDGGCKAIKAMINKTGIGYRTEIIKDYAGIDRIIVAQKTSDKL
jgi:release factor glutamine methyltransferase